MGFLDQHLSSSQTFFLCGLCLLLTLTPCLSKLLASGHPWDSLSPRGLQHPSHNPWGLSIQTAPSRPSHLLASSHLIFAIPLPGSPEFLCLQSLGPSPDPQVSLPWHLPFQATRLWGVLLNLHSVAKLLACKSKSPESPLPCLVSGCDDAASHLHSPGITERVLVAGARRVLSPVTDAWHSTNMRQGSAATFPGGPQSPLARAAVGSTCTRSRVPALGRTTYP